MKYSIAVLILCAGIGQYEAANCTEKPPTSSEIYSLHIDSYIRYRYATTTVVSRVVNPKNNSQEIFFHMNLPETAFITSFVIEVNGKKYEAYLKEKEEAKQIYDKAVASGQSAGHVATSSRDSNHFKISVNVEALGKIKFTLKYEELLQRTLGLYKQVINLNPGQTVRDLQVNVYITESSDIKSLFVPELKVSNEIETDEKENKIVKITRPSGNKAIIHYSPNVDDQEKVGGDCFEGQFIVQYDVDRIHSCGQVLIDEGYFVHFYAPDGLDPLRKLVVFVLDLSGSMYGHKLTQLKQAMTTILDELREGDYFSIVDFSYSVTVHNLDSPTGSAVIAPDYSRPHQHNNTLPTSLEVQNAYPANKDYVNKAKQIISKMTAGGGTNIYDALKTAVQVSHKAYEKIRNDLKDKNEEALEPMIMFLTDGEPTVGISNLGSIRSMVRELNIPRTPIYSLGFGYGADMNFLKKLSLENGAFGKKIYEASDAALQLRNFYKLISSPLLSNVTFTYIPSQVDSNSVTKKDFRSLSDGSELIVAGKLLLNDGEVEIDIHSIGSNGTTSCTVQGSKIPVDKTEVGDAVVPEEDKKVYGSLERLWAYLTVKQLLDEQDLLDEDTKRNESSKLKETALNLALKYKFVTPLTSLIVVKPNETDAITELEDSSRNDGLPVPMYSGRPSASMAASFPGSYTRSASVQYSSMLTGFSGVPVYHRSGPLRPRPSYRTSNAFAGPAFAISSLQVTTPPPPPPLPIYTTESHDIDRMEIGSEEDSENTVGTTTTTTQNTPYQGNLTLSDLDWLGEILKNNYTMEVSIPVGNSTQTYTILDNPVILSYQNCTNLPGICTHLVNCILPDFTASLQEFLRYFCPITGNFVGVCCPFSQIHPTSHLIPENPTISIPTSSATVIT